MERLFFSCNGRFSAPCRDQGPPPWSDMLNLPIYILYEKKSNAKYRSQYMIGGFLLILSVRLMPMVLMILTSLKVLTTYYRFYLCKSTFVGCSPPIWPLENSYRSMILYQRGILKCYCSLMVTVLFDVPKEPANRFIKNSFFDTERIPVPQLRNLYWRNCKGLGIWCDEIVG